MRFLRLFKHMRAIGLADQPHASHRARGPITTSASSSTPYATASIGLADQTHASHRARGPITTSAWSSTLYATASTGLADQSQHLGTYFCDSLHKGRGPSLCHSLPEPRGPVATPKTENCPKAYRSRAIESDKPRKFASAAIPISSSDESGLPKW